MLAGRLNTPIYANLREDVVALESNVDRLGEILSLCEDSKTLTAAALGRLGNLAALVTDALLADVLNVACARTAEPRIKFTVNGDPILDGRWAMAEPSGPASNAQLTTVGRLLRRGRFIDGVAKLLAHTDALCTATIASADPSIPGLADQVFAATYVFWYDDGLPVSAVTHAAEDRPLLDAEDAATTLEVAVALLREGDELGSGTLYLAARLLRNRFAPAMPDVIVKCLRSGLYHLRLVGLDLAENSASRLDDVGRQAVIDAVRSLPTNNLMLNGSIVDALSALDAITPGRDLDDITAEIATVLTMEEDPLGARMAYGIISGQFESDAIGPYYEAVQSLPAADRERLLAMALNGSDPGFINDDWILHEFDDLSTPLVRTAVTAYIARSEPSRWLSAQHGMSAVARALTLLAADGATIPEPDESGSADPAWRAGMILIMSAADGADDSPAVNEAWAAFVGAHRDALASFLSQLAGARMLADGPGVYERVIVAMPRAGVDALIWSLEHPDQVRPLGRPDVDLRRDIIELLGRLGDPKTAEALRRFADEPGIGEVATAAVRAIEERSVG
jgi:hypothetical protein